MTCNKLSEIPIVHSQSIALWVRPWLATVKKLMKDVIGLQISGTKGLAAFLFLNNIEHKPKFRSFVFIVVPLAIIKYNHLFVYLFVYSIYFQKCLSICKVMLQTVLV